LNPSKEFQPPEIVEVNDTFDAARCAGLLHAKAVAVGSSAVVTTLAVVAALAAGSLVVLGCMRWQRHDARATASSSASSSSRTAEPKKLKARYYKGLLQLAEPLDLPDDTEVEILVRPIKRS